VHRKFKWPCTAYLNRNHYILNPAFLSNSKPCRSNLAKTWFGYELQRRHPELCVPVCHPGVIDSGLTVVPTGLQTIKSVLLARPEDGEQ
jgi:hypothetical protein